MIDRTENRIAGIIQQNNVTLLEAIAIDAGEHLEPDDLMDSEMASIRLAQEYRDLLRREHARPHPTILAIVRRNHCLIPVHITVTSSHKTPREPATTGHTTTAADCELHLHTTVEEDLLPMAGAILQEHLRRTGTEGITAISRTAESITDINELGQGHHHLSITAGYRLQEIYGKTTIQEIVRRIIRRQRRATGSAVNAAATPMTVQTRYDRNPAGQTGR